tara:strand:- start:4142 stop:4804 length:663 start_codon:yes stop_codon:yes gene_type:complete
MPVSKTVTLYSFEELNTTIQDNIISAYVQDLPGWWSDDVEERIRNEAKSLGINNFDFSWSGFWSQGDGLSFTGQINFKNWLFILTERLSSKQFSDLCGKTPQEIVQLKEDNRIEWGGCVIERFNYQYCHENTVQVSEPDSKLGWDERRGYPSDNEIMSIFGENVQRLLREWKNELCNRWYSELQNAYESVTERDNIVRDINSKELLFTSSGTVVDEGEMA